MKTTTKNLDDIIFEKRNKEYGAYLMRRTYNKNMMSALCIAIVIFLMGISIPLIASYINGNNRNFKTEVNEKVSIFNKPPEVKPILPQLPPETKKATVFRAPIVTADPNEVTDVDLADLKDNTANKNPFDTMKTADIPTDGGGKEVIETEHESTPFTFVEEMPEFPGGDVNRIKFLSENIKYPQIARESGVQGPVYLTFVVEKDGSITNVNLLRGIGAGCDEEAMRVLKLMPKWKPGRQNGKEVRVQFNMPIAFTLKD